VARASFYRQRPVLGPSAAGIISVSGHVDNRNHAGAAIPASVRPNSLEREIEVRAGNILGQANHLMECGVLPQPREEINLRKNT